VTQGSVLGPLLFSIYRWCHGSCSQLGLTGRYFRLDEGPQHSTQPCKDRNAYGIGQPNTSSQLFQSASFLISNSARHLRVMTEDRWIKLHRTHW